VIGEEVSAVQTHRLAEPNGTDPASRRMPGLADVPSFLRARAGHGATGAARAFAAAHRAAGAGAVDNTLGGHLARLAGGELVGNIFRFRCTCALRFSLVALSCLGGKNARKEKARQ